jgi:putative heme-binding domain-containing protein
MRAPLIAFAVVTSFLLAGALRPGAGVRAAAQPADDALVRTGAALFLERCADCHGADARGVSGPGLVGLFASGATDERVFRTIREGVPGSIMPPSTAPDADVHAIVAYLKSLSSSGPTARGAADPQAGRTVFEASCASCHRADGRGGRLGPDLSQIAESRTRDQLRESIRQASASIPSGYQTVMLVTRDGRTIRGTRKGEDAFSIQIMDERERLQGYRKADLREVTREPRSLMPDYGPDRLSEADLEALLDFLNTLRAPDAPRRGVDRP